MPLGVLAAQDIEYEFCLLFCKPFLQMSVVEDSLMAENINDRPTAILLAPDVKTVLFHNHSSALIKSTAKEQRTGGTFVQ
jgi:hypothetical protein